MKMVSGLDSAKIKFQIMNILQIKNGRVEIRKENGSLVRTIGSG